MIRLPNDVSRCTGEPSMYLHGLACPIKLTCKRYLAPLGQWTPVMDTQWDGDKCEMRIPTDD